MTQIDLFSYTMPKFKIDKKVRLIELFAGIGSQAKALQRLRVDFEHYKVVEIDKYCINSYNAMFGTNFKTSDITKLEPSELEIVECDKYIYIVTYSFPCVDLSLAGKQKGFSKEDHTRSGLLWEVERLLDGLNELPQILLLENVPQIVSKKNINDFNKWRQKLESLGYSNYFKILNAKDFGIPQNRRRFFMVSILGNYYYEFPQKQKLELRLKDMLEDEVDEKYYLSDKMMKFLLRERESWKGTDKAVINKSIAGTITTREGNTSADTSTYIGDGMKDNTDIRKLEIKEKTKKGFSEAMGGDGVYINRPHQKRGVVQKGMIQTIKTSSDDIGVVVDDKPKLVGGLKK